jgi:hypothetical protein
MLFEGWLDGSRLDAFGRRCRKAVKLGRHAECTRGADAAVAVRAADPDRLAFTTVAVFRAHPHISNVLTHIFRGDWGKLERAVAAILAPETDASDLSALDRNLVQLLRGGRGTTGRVFKPYFEWLAERILGGSDAAALLAHLDRLLLELGGERDRYPSRTDRRAAQPLFEVNHWQAGEGVHHVER